jgi:IclR family acetate operon transcriptional repressor
VEKACLLMEVLSDFPAGLGISDLAQRVGMYKSTTHRLLGTLMKRGYVEQDEQTGRYKLGYTLLDLGMKLLSSIDLRREAAPFLQKLSADVNEAVHLAHLDQGEIVYIDKVEGSNTIRMHSRIGTRVPAHATGLGKVILAFRPPMEAIDLVDRYGLARLTEHTITDRAMFLAVLKQTRELGYAFDLEENELGICYVAAPIWDNTGRVVAACSVSGPSIRMSKERLHQLVPAVKQTGRLISERLGYGTGTASV